MIKFDGQFLVGLCNLEYFTFDKISWSPESQYPISPPKTVSPKDLEFAVKSSRKRAFDITSDIISQLLEAMSFDAVSGVQASRLPELAGKRKIGLR
jgi:hypothetical protein